MRVNVRAGNPAVAAASILLALAGMATFHSSVHVVAFRADGSVHTMSDQPEPLHLPNPGATTDPDAPPIIGSPPPNGGKKPNLLYW